MGALARYGATDGRGSDLALCSITRALIWEGHGISYISVSPVTPFFFQIIGFFAFAGTPVTP